MVLYIWYIPPPLLHLPESGIHVRTDTQRGKKVMAHARSEGPDEHAHPCSLIWTFSVPRYILQYPLILYADNEGPDQPARMRRLIWACVVRKVHKGPFRALHINYIMSLLHLLL